MDTQRLAGMIGIAAVVTLGVVGVDRWTKDAKARGSSEVVQATSAEPQSALPQSALPFLPMVRDSHFQVDPSVPQLPPLPKESDAPPLISTGELEKKLKQSIDDLQKVLPSSLPSVEESSFPPPAAP